MAYHYPEANMSEYKPDQEFTGQYFNAMRETLKSAEESISRDLFFLLLLGFLFVMIDQGGVSDINLGVTHLTKVKIIQPFLPLIFAYIYGSVATTIVAIILLHSDLLISLETINMGSAEIAFIPANSFFSFPYYMVNSSDNQDLPSSQFWALTMFLFLRLSIILFVPPLFLIYTVWQVLPTHSILPTISVILSICLITSNIITFVLYLRTLLIDTTSTSDFVTGQPTPSPGLTSTRPPGWRERVRAFTQGFARGSQDHLGQVVGDAGGDDFPDAEVDGEQGAREPDEGPSASKR
jgi:hypothetical protein